MPPVPPGDHPAWSELVAALDWLPLACMLLAADGTALAVSRAWSGLSGLAAEASRADGWISAVDLPDREVLRARLRDAALAGQTGYADVRLAGQWSRWWWRPVRSGRLIVCVADLGDSWNRDDQWHRDRSAMARLVHRSEFENLVGGALRRARHHGGHVAVAAIRLPGIAGPGGTEPSSGLLPALAELVSAAAGPVGAAAQVAPGDFLILLDDLGASRDAGTIASQVREAVTQMVAAGRTLAGKTAVTGVAVADGSGRSAGELIENALSAAQPVRQAAEAGPPAPRHAVIGAAAPAWPASPGMLVNRLLMVGLALQCASALADGPVTARLQQALDQMDDIIRDIQTAVLESQIPRQRRGA